MNEASCAMDGCSRKVAARGICRSHYNEGRSAGTLPPLVGRAPRPPRLCSVDGCSKLHDARGYCTSHYMKWRSYGDPLISKRPPRVPCQAEEPCERDAEARGYCLKHYRRYLRTGSTKGTGRPGRGNKIAVSAICSVPGCGRKHDARGYCQGHRLRVLKDGHPGDTPVKDREWKPGVGVRIDKAGYVVVYGDRTKGRRNKHEHRLVMEELLGRSLVKGEEVHHRNLVRHDNRPSNLELWLKSQPAGARVEDLIEHWVEMLQRYAPERLAEAERATQAG